MIKVVLLHDVLDNVAYMQKKYCWRQSEQLMQAKEWSKMLKYVVYGTHYRVIHISHLQIYSSSSS